jgi:5-dehydro-2-deoxygluconokinase
VSDVGIEVAVVGRVSYDLNPLQAETPLEDVRTFERSVGGFAGNVCTGTARLDARTLIVSAVGDDPHGRYVRKWLQAEGVDTGALVVHPSLRTALASYESWPPDRFPITLFRSPTAPDWEMTADDVAMDDVAAVPVLLISGTTLARKPSLQLTRTLLEQRERTPASQTIIDLDWRPMAWDDAADFGPRLSSLLDRIDVVVGGEEEYAAAGLSPDELATDGRWMVVVKHGPDGSTLIDKGVHTSVPGVEVPVVLGLGAGDAFIAAFTASLVETREPVDALARGNAAGAIVAARPMCSPAMPTPVEIDAVLAGARVVAGEVMT